MNIRHCNCAVNTDPFQLIRDCEATSKIICFRTTSNTVKIIPLQ